MNAEPILRASLHTEVADRVRARILEQVLLPGTRIDELALAAALGISRTPLREALKVLASEGLVELVAGKGAFVTELTPTDIDQLFPVMAMLEGRCAHEAVQRLAAGDLDRLRALHDLLEAHAGAGDVAAYYAVNFEFHQAVERLAGNPWLIRVTAELRRFLRLSRGSQLNVPGRLQQSLREHRRFMAALSRRDANLAERVMNEHLLAQQRAWRALHARWFRRAPRAATDGARPDA